MPRKGSRKRLARGIYEDATGRAAIYRDAAGRQRERRFPPFTPLKEIRDAIAGRKAKQRGSGRSVADRGTLDAAINTWASLEQHLASWRERRAELRAWSELYGTIRLQAISPNDVRRAMSLWAQKGLAPKTIAKVESDPGAALPSVLDRLAALRHVVVVGVDGVDVDVGICQIAGNSRKLSRGVGHNRFEHLILVGRHSSAVKSPAGTIGIVHDDSDEAFTIETEGSESFDVNAGLGENLSEAGQPPRPVVHADHKLGHDENLVRIGNRWALRTRPGPRVRGCPAGINNRARLSESCCQ